MNSSYKKEITYGHLLDGITYGINPKLIVEIGILDGYSLKHFINGSSKETIIKAYDIFEDFNGNHANKDKLIERFKEHKNVSIEYGDFYKLYDTLEEIDILHIDIANNGDVYEFAMKNYLPKLSKNGIIILEGGSEERDNVEWMIKYNKPKIQTIVKKYNMKVIGTFPSISLFRK